MGNCQYVRQTYFVPACIGRRVTVNGKNGIIAADRGNYIGVNFDCDKPGVILNVHPTDNVHYLNMDQVRPMTRSQANYQHYLNVADCYENFLSYLKHQQYLRQQENLS